MCDTCKDASIVGVFQLKYMYIHVDGLYFYKRIYNIYT